MPPETSVTATDLEVDAAPVLSYPMAHNRLAVVSRIAVRHRGPAVAGASVQVEVRDVEGRIGSAWERLVDLAPDAETQLTDIDLHLDADAMHAAAQQLIGLHDFTTFRSAHCQSQSPVKTLDRLTVSRHGDELIVDRQRLACAGRREQLDDVVQTVTRGEEIGADAVFRPGAWIRARVEQRPHVRR